MVREDGNNLGIHLNNIPNSKFQNFKKGSKNSYLHNLAPDVEIHWVDLMTSGIVCREKQIMAH